MHIQYQEADLYIFEFDFFFVNLIAIMERYGGLALNLKKKLAFEFNKNLPLKDQ